MSQRIRIKLKSYDHRLVDNSADKIVRTVKPTGAVVSGPISINISPKISPILGTTTVYLGCTSLLSNSTPGGTWSSSNPKVASVSSRGLITGVSLGTTKITYTVIRAGVAITKSTTVVVNPLTIPTITANGPTTFYQGESVMLISSPADSYSWKLGENYLGKTSRSITITEPGSYTVITNSETCSATSAPILITIMPPNPNPTPMPVPPPPAPTYYAPPPDPFYPYPYPYYPYPYGYPGYYYHGHGMHGGWHHRR